MVVVGAVARVCVCVCVMTMTVMMPVLGSMSKCIIAWRTPHMPALPLSTVQGVEGSEQMADDDDLNWLVLHANACL